MTGEKGIEDIKSIMSVLSNKLNVLNPVMSSTGVIGYRLPIDKITSAFILGHGIPSFDLWQLDGISSKFLPGESPDGVLKLNYRQEKLVGKTLSIQGKYKNPKNSEIKSFIKN